jgi:hypothetical protein
MNENFEQGFDDEEKSLLTEQAFRYLDSGARWARFLAIVGYIGIGLLVIGALFAIMAGASFSGRTRMYGPAVPFGLIGFGYLVMAVLYFFPVHYLYNFATRARDAFSRRSPQQLEEAMRYMHMHYQFLGILTIIVMSLYGLMLLIGIFGAMAR